jgi:hypothetical protein
MCCVRLTSLVVVSLGSRLVCVRQSLCEGVDVVPNLSAGEGLVCVACFLRLRRAPCPVSHYLLFFLLTASVNAAPQEPAALRAEAGRLLGASQALAVHHYRHFVSTAQAFSATKRDAQAMDETVKTLLDNTLPRFTKVRV